MAKMLGSPPLDRAERHVYEQFRKQLPDDWMVVPNVQWSVSSGPKGREIVRDGQSDLVIVAPGHGVVVVEVKATHEFWVGEDCRWFRRGHQGEVVELRESPPEQATRNMYQVMALLKDQGGWHGHPCTFAYVVIYPNGEATQLPATFDHSTLATARQMHDLHRVLRRALDLRTGGATRPFTSDDAEAVVSILANRGFRVVRADTAQDVSDDAAAIERLTSQQFAALRGIFELPAVGIVGPAGSGKTLLALWRLRAVVEEGRNALYVCYNTNLAAALQLAHPDLRDRIINVDKLFASVAKSQPPPGKDGAYYRDTLPNLAFEHFIGLPEAAKYDVVIVDEGQDFAELQLIALRELLRTEGSQWLFFADWRQDVFRAGKGGVFGADVVFRLHYNCRNTQKVNESTNDFVRDGDRIPSMPGMPGGTAPEVFAIKDRDAMALKAYELAKKWGGGTVVLSPYQLENSSMSRVKKGHGLELSTRLSDLGKPGKLYFSTIKSFKGMEAEAVIVVDVSKPGSSVAFGMEDLYVACTRPTARLSLLCDEDGAGWLVGPPARS